MFVFAVFVDWSVTQCGFKEEHCIQTMQVILTHKLHKEFFGAPLLGLDMVAWPGANRLGELVWLLLNKAKLSTDPFPYEILLGFSTLMWLNGRGQQLSYIEQRYYA